MLSLQLKKYRHIIVALIEQSLGYFSPATALEAIISHKNKRGFACDLYLHLAHNRLKFFHNNTNPDDFDSILLKVNADAIKAAFKWRHSIDLTHYINLVDNSIATSNY